MGQDVPDFLARIPLWQWNDRIEINHLDPAVYGCAGINRILKLAFTFPVGLEPLADNAVTSDEICNNDGRALLR